ncbi:PRC-barrel domain protein [Syntrophobotulus glycolicus DSM 8271]|uniref:PRC-barrel domain protein n=1 Tax=Syntrophobotulus glycolicus (strain DSM 8271 / FlGlyR) TaxID=645991 RepID=F0T0K1_SYNGF|nr:PRC-barrel domain-containing protein [Syntrophobotulus glycolicus]ADY55066.1 PRC-barrel domain protein [Syntrophobotulus glycolicus DSM 8271]
MKSIKEIIGLKIISIAEGTQVGTVKDLVLNPAGGLLDFFIIDKQTDSIGARTKAIAFKDIQGLGEFAITIPDQKVIQNIISNSQVLELIDQNVKVIGAKVLTIKGTIIGEVTEIYFDEETGKINKCVYEDKTKEQKEINAESIVTYGENLLIVNDGSRQNKSFGQEAVIEDKLPPQIQAQEVQEVQEVQEEQEIPAPPGITEAAATSDSAENSPNDGFNLFEQRQLQYFVGKKVVRNIKLDNGDILPIGQIITSDTIGKIKTRATLMEVTSHLEKG